MLIHDLLVFEGNVWLVLGLSTAGSLYCMLPDSLILYCTHCLVVDARGGQ